MEQFPELAVGPPPEEVNGYRTFGYLGRAIKLGPLVFDTWAELLSAVPTARLLLKSDQYADREQVHRVINALVGRGIDQGRLDVRGATDRRTHLLAHHEVDVCLDPFPQGGGATAGDCLWMGVPMVTLAGERICERIGTSLNMQAGRPDDIVTSRADYVRRAMQVTSTAPERQAIRTTFEASPSMDRGAYARAVEHAYRMLWRRWCAEGGRTVAA